MLDAKGQVSGADVCVRESVCNLCLAACVCVHFNLFLFACVPHVSFV